MSLTCPDEDQERRHSILAPLVVLVIFVLTIFTSTRQAASTEKLDAATATRLVKEVDDLKRDKKYEEALAIMERLYEDYPTHINLRRIADINRELERYAEEAEAWEKFMLVAPTPDEACLALGEAYRLAGELEKMVDACERCVAMDPSSDNYRALAEAYTATNRTDSAAEALSALDRR